MRPEDIANSLIANFEDVIPRQSWGETSFFVNPGRRLPSGTYFATLKEKDGENDRSSNLDRQGVFRLSIGPQRKDFESRFGTPPARPSKGGVIDGPWDFSEKNTLMPHPVYGWMSWVCVLNPSDAMFEKLNPLLISAHEKALKSAQKRLRN